MCTYIYLFNLQRFKGKSEGEEISNRDNKVEKERK